MSAWPRSIGGLTIAELALIAVAGLWLATCAGCASAPTAPAVVKEAVAEPPCRVSLPPRPTFPADTLAVDADLWTIGTTLWADRLARRAYTLQLETAIAGCIK